jgi:hypothetical protein
MDSILVADMNRHIFKDYHHSNTSKAPPLLVASSRQPVHLAPPPQQQQQQQQIVQQQFVVGHHQLGLPPGGLEKRPTFDNIDKRSSWSLDTTAQFLNRHMSHVVVDPIMFRFAARFTSVMDLDPH